MVGGVAPGIPPPAGGLGRVFPLALWGRAFPHTPRGYGRWGCRPALVGIRPLG
ncbi:MAG: hypothetical protein ACP5NB_09925 [Chloroflexia bacterium]